MPKTRFWSWILVMLGASRVPLNDAEAKAMREADIAAGRRPPDPPEPEPRPVTVVHPPKPSAPEPSADETP